jgi:hypothetical protein
MLRLRNDQRADDRTTMAKRDRLANRNMRHMLIAAIAAVTVLAGCTDDPAPPLDGEGEGDMEMVEVPAPLQFQGNAFYPVYDTNGLVPQCPTGSNCMEHDVAVPAGEWLVTFTLTSHSGTVTSTGTPYGSDYDLFVEGVGESTETAGVQDVVQSVLMGGTYTALIEAWYDIDGSYTLDVTFALPA